ncbi:MAG: hypothetical protein QNJ16_03635 [Rhodobacter sp.]|nr:hypothetical protein [Rhodobacter sp.]
MSESTFDDIAPPAILISSPSDVQTARETLASRISRVASNLRIDIEGFRWRESASDGLEYRSSETIQNQINEILDGRTELTFVMFGEKIGHPFGQTPPEDAASLLEEWEPLGLTYPWPDEPEAIDAALEAGSFPLTGTVYEMLVAFGVERRDRKLRLKVGYVADVQVRADTELGDVRFNQRKAFERLPGNPGSIERDAAERDYRIQTRGLINLFQALQRSSVGLEPHRFDTEEEMAGAFGSLAESALRRRAAAAREEQAFKPDLSHFSLDDIMNLPDRVDHRKRLHDRLPGDGEAGRVLLLKGPSGCGKSSLLQKGILGELKGTLAKAIPIAIRPTDFTPRSEPTPLRQFLGQLLDLLEERGVAGLHRLRQPVRGTTDDQLETTVTGLSRALTEGGLKLVLGVDQFEELLDSASLEGPEDRAKPGSWWQLLRFIGRIVREPGIWVAATLETQRTDRLEDMRLAEDDVLHTVQEPVSFASGDVKSFVLHVARDHGLPLDESVADAVMRMAERFEKERSVATAGLAQASFLPLLSLWMHRLFAGFRDRLVRGEDGIAGVFDTTTKLITPDDVLRRGLKFDLENLVADLVQDAWKEADAPLAAELAGLGRYHVKDNEAFFKQVNALARAGPDIARLTQHCDVPSGFDVDFYLSSLKQQILQAFPGVEKRPEELSEDALLSIGNFYNGLIKLDASGNKRLTEMPRQSSVTSIQKLIETHLSRRLLEPVGENSVRLVHQAVVDNWRPAVLWYEARLENFQRRLKLERLAADNDPADVANREGMIAEATKVLAYMAPVWSVIDSSVLSAADRKFVDFCLEVIAQANGDEVFESNGRETSVLAITASYGRVETIERWIEARRPKGSFDRLKAWFLGQPEDIVNRRLKPSGQSALFAAAWASEDGVDVLLRHGAQQDLVNDEGWHPIAGAVQSGTMAAYLNLLSRYESINPVVGPDGLTLAHEAARSTRAEPMEYLAARLQPPLPVSSEHKTTPLQIAASAGRTRQVELLLPFGDVALRDANSTNCLDQAVYGDYGDTIRAVLDSPHLSDGDRVALLTGEKTSDEETAISPLSLAAVLAAPKAMEALLEHCPNPLDEAHLERGRNPLETLLFHNDRPSTTGSDQDRVLECLNLLLANEHIAKAPVQNAIGFTRHLPEARRILENSFILDGDLSDADPAALLAFAISPRQRVARAAIEKRPDILDHPVRDSKTGAHELLAKASPGVLSFLLRRAILPNRMDAALFTLQAGLRILKDFSKDADPSDDRWASAQRDAFLGVDRAILHPLLAEHLDEASGDEIPRLIEIGGVDGAVAPFLHRLAIRNEAALYDRVLFGMTTPLTEDAFGRRPSDLAPEALRTTFTEIETRYDAQRSVQ